MSRSVMSQRRSNGSVTAAEPRSFGILVTWRPSTWTRQSSSVAARFDGAEPTVPDSEALGPVAARSEAPRGD